VSERYEQPDLEKARQIQTSHLEFAMLWEVSTGSAKFRQAAAVQTSFLCSHVSSAASTPTALAVTAAVLMQEELSGAGLLWDSATDALTGASSRADGLLSAQSGPFIFTLLLMHGPILVVQ